MGASIDSNMNTPIQPNTQDIPNQFVNPDAFMQLLALFQGQETHGGLKIDAVASTTMQSMKVEDGEIGIARAVRDTLNIHNPNLPGVNEDFIALAMESLNAANGDHFSKEFTTLGKVLLQHLATTEKAEGSPYASLVAAASGANGTTPPNSQICAFLGGLVMVSLTEILSNYAKSQSAIDKLMSNLWVQTEVALKEIAKEMHDNTLEKTQAQVMSLMLQAVMSAVAVGLQVAGSIFAMKELGKFDPATKQHTGSSTIADMKQSMGQAGAQIFSGVGSNLVKAWEAGVVGQIEAENITLQNVEQMFQKMADKYAQASNDAHGKVAEAYDLLKNLFSALAQASKSLTGR